MINILPNRKMGLCKKRRTLGDGIQMQDKGQGPSDCEVQ